jgi:hypothetical protein
MLTIIKMFLVAGLLTIIASPGGAEVFSEAAKLGANVGAMKYCADCCADEDDEKKYKLLRLKTLKEYGDLESDEKAKALILRKKAEDDGDYLGQKLDKDRCDSIRKMLYLKY